MKTNRNLQSAYTKHLAGEVEIVQGMASNDIRVDHTNILSSP